MSMMWLIMALFVVVLPLVAGIVLLVNGIVNRTKIVIILGSVILVFVLIEVIGWAAVMLHILG